VPRTRPPYPDDFVGRRSAPPRRKPGDSVRPRDPDLTGDDRFAMEVLDADAPLEPDD
jgi:hypothetical protein